MKPIISFLLFLLLFTGCKEKEAMVLPPAGFEEQLAVPFDTVQKGDMAVEVYDFANFKSFLHKDNDSIYVVNFWATWCKPCVKEIPELEQIQKEYADRKVKVILASLDFPDMIESRLIPFMEEMKLRSRVLVMDEPDANAWIPQVDPTWSGGLPATLVYSRSQRKFFNKPITYEQLQATIDPLVTINN